jgi:folylpolyglutamate synthase
MRVWQLTRHHLILRFMSSTSTTPSAHAAPTADRSYESAIATLYTLTSNAADLQQWVDRRLEDRQVTSIGPMREYLRRIECDISSLRVVHVAGTKGKGSTCAFVERILRQCGLRTGLYTSPHLRCENERFRINGAAISNDVFALHFWKCYERLRASCTPELGMPTWFRMMTLIGLDVFVASQLDVAVVEVGVGGRADATTVVDPVVCGITSLGFDHMNVLGNTLPEIASEKAGIFKSRVPAFTCVQRDDAAATLERIAAEKMTPLAVVTPGASPFPLGIAGEHQHSNAALAIALSAAFLARTNRQHLLTPSFAHVTVFALQHQACERATLNIDMTAAALNNEFLCGIMRCRWPARSQLIVDTQDPNVRFAVDGAHTVESMDVAVTWFRAQVRRDALRALVFNCAHTKQPEKLLGCIVRGGIDFDLVIFTTNRTDRRSGHNRERGEVPWPADTPSDVDRSLPCLAFQEQLAACYRSLRPDGAEQVVCVHSVVDARDAVLQLAAARGAAVDVLATGSLYLAGSILEVQQVDTLNL